ncbi:hypothetical protein BC830DRAFT_1080014 [Chytriomyces sp. MP71]|nr:hypothetical protein BC830DRAFT_1080014 [Chytriomyces sp. MP71]
METEKRMSKSKFEMRNAANHTLGDSESGADGSQSDAESGHSDVSDAPNGVSTRSASQTPRFPSLKRMSIMVSPQRVQPILTASALQPVGKLKQDSSAAKKPAIFISPPLERPLTTPAASPNLTDQDSDGDSPIFQSVRQLALKNDPVPTTIFRNPTYKGKPANSAAPSKPDPLHPKHATSSSPAPAITQPTKSKKKSKKQRPVSFAPSTNFDQQPKNAYHSIQPWQAAPGYPVFYFQPAPHSLGNSALQPVYFQPPAIPVLTSAPPAKSKTLISFSNEDYATSGTLKTAAENSRALRERALKQEVLRARGEIRV